MNQRIVHIVFGVIALCLVLSAAALAETATGSGPPLDPRAMKFDPVTFTTPKVERVVLENGMIVYLLPDAELPLASITAMIRTGAVYEPKDKVGLTGIVSTVMRTGGTARMTGDQIDEELEFLAASVSVVIGAESGTATLDVLKKDFRRGLAIFADVLRSPAFEAGKVEMAKRQALEAIRRRPENPAGITAREFRKLLFGADHPFGRESTLQTVSSITREDLISFHRQFFAPGAVMLGITGDFDKTEMLTALRAAFGDWQPKSIRLPQIPAIGAPAARSVNIVRREITQTHLRVGQLTVKEDDPDYFALALLDDILGGNSFTSRLFRDVRSRQGLAYSVGSAIRPGNMAPGIFLMHALTKAPTTYQALSSMLGNLERIRQEPVSDQELQHSKDAFMNSFVFSFADSGQIVSRLMELDYYGLPADFLQRFRDSVVKLTKDDLLRAAQKHLHPDRVIILAVGKEEDFEQPLAAFGQVHIITLTPGG